MEAPRSGTPSLGFFFCDPTRGLAAVGSARDHAGLRCKARNLLARGAFCVFKGGGNPMMTKEDQHAAVVRAYVDNVYNGHDLQSVEKYLTTDWVAHWLGDRVLRGIAAWQEATASFFEAFPDATYTLIDLFVAGDKAVWRGVWRATQHNDWGGIVATRRTAMWSAIVIGRFAGGKLVENWAEYDRFNMVHQLVASSDNKSFEQVRSMH